MNQITGGKNMGCVKEFMDSWIFKGPFRCVVAGASGSGKSSLMVNILKHHLSLIEPELKGIVWCYSEWQTGYESLLEHNNTKDLIHFVKGPPSNDMFNVKAGHTLIVIDDQMNTIVGREYEEMFTKKSHHTNTSIIHLVQNIFLKSMRTMSLNSDYLILFKNPRDMSQIRHLASQMYPGNSKFLVAAYTEATHEHPHTYLAIDLTQSASNRGRVRTNILPGQVQWVYIPA